MCLNILVCVASGDKSSIGMVPSCSAAMVPPFAQDIVMTLGNFLHLGV